MKGSLSLSLIFFLSSVSPGNLFRVERGREEERGREREKEEKKWEQNQSKAYWLNTCRVRAGCSQSGRADGGDSGPQQQHRYLLLLYGRECVCCSPAAQHIQRKVSHAFCITLRNYIISFQKHFFHSFIRTCVSF